MIKNVGVCIDSSGSNLIKKCPIGSKQCETLGREPSRCEKDINKTPRMRRAKGNISQSHTIHMMKKNIKVKYLFLNLFKNRIPRLEKVLVYTAVSRKRRRTSASTLN